MPSPKHSPVSEREFNTDIEGRDRGTKQLNVTIAMDAWDRLNEIKAAEGIDKTKLVEEWIMNHKVREQRNKQ